MEGHTCRCGSDQANLEVGRKRAEAIREFLISKRVIPADKITAISFGSSRPVESAGAASLPASVCDRDEIHSRNRRVVVVVYGQANLVTKNTPRLDVSFLSRRAGTRGYELLSDGGHLRGGDEFKIRLHAGAAVYAYALHRGSSGKWDVLFPEKPGAASPVGSSNPLESGQELSIPTADAGFLLTGDPGTEETYVYSSPEPDQALEALVKSIQNGADVKLLPPALVGPEVTIEKPQPKQGRTTSGTQRNNQVEKDGTGGAPPPPDKTAMPIREGEEQVQMKDLARPDDLRVPRLPPDPAGYVRFKHLK